MKSLEGISMFSMRSCNALRHSWWRVSFLRSIDHKYKSMLCDHVQKKDPKKKLYDFFYTTYDDNGI